MKTKTADPNEDNTQSIENEAIKTTKTVEILHNTKRKVSDESHKDVTKPSRWQS